MRKRRRRTRTKRSEAGPGEVPVALALGGNLGPVRERLVEALLALAAFLAPAGAPAATARAGTLPAARRLAVSPLYRTTPVSDLPQPDYLNAAAVGWTARAPREVLAFGQELERRAGRRPGGPPNAPRPLDVDLLVHGDSVIGSPDLVLPHPRLAERAFVLVPLAAVAPELRVPPGGATVAELLARLPRRLAGVRRVPWGEAAARRLGLDPAAEREDGPREDG